MFRFVKFFPRARGVSLAQSHQRRRRPRSLRRRANAEGGAESVTRSAVRDVSDESGEKYDSGRSGPLARGRKLIWIIRTGPAHVVGPRVYTENGIGLCRRQWRQKQQQQQQPDLTTALRRR